MRPLALLSLAVAPLLAQVGSIAFSNDGSTLLLSTYWQLRGQENAAEARLFDLGSGRPVLLASGAALPEAHVSGDGRIALWRFGNGRLTGRGLTPAQFEALPADPGAYRLSQSGHYLLWHSLGCPASLRRFDLRLPPSTWEATLRQPRTEGFCSSWEVLGLADDGRVLVRDFQPGRLGVWAGTGEPVWQPFEGLFVIASAGGRHLLYYDGDFGRIVRLDVATGGKTVVWTNPAAFPQFFLAGSLPMPQAISADGNTMILQVSQMVSRTDSATATLRCLGEPVECRAIDIPEGYAARARLNASGTRLYYSSDRDALRSVDFASGRTAEHIPPTPPSLVAGVASAGSILSLAPRSRSPFPGNIIPASRLDPCRSFSFVLAPPPSQPPVPNTWSATWNGRPLTLYWQNSPGVAIQVPWNASGDGNILRLDQPGSPFVPGALRVSIGRPTPLVFRDGQQLDTGGLAFRRRNFALAFKDNNQAMGCNQPAARGDIVTLYWVGLGAVAPAIADHQAATDARHQVTEPLTCVFDPEGERLPVETPYQGLAPGLVGVYQMNLRIPNYARSSNSRYFWCGRDPQPDAAVSNGDAFPLPLAP